MRIRVVSDIVLTEYDGERVDPDFVREYLTNAGSTIVPGVTSWEEIVVTMPDPATIMVEAKLVTEDIVTSGDYKGQEVSEEWIGEYIDGADVYWLAPGVLDATEITVGSNV